ncbi:F-box/LRR-repeat protein 6 isoform X2 [Neocloeon triangulifer]|uniref:F-box/LRR-repeat protein 6 isoform X2 n=1 Tax=Neocloeon triangulifer TaxID=2078957 RepID=UPI00286F982F|nr:F-box/LRR-repeat protein 6 isoform X2 [Neocloeon triangulifer]
MDPSMNSCFNLGGPPNMDMYNPASCSLSDPTESALREFLLNETVNNALSMQNNGVSDINDIPDELKVMLDEPLSRDWVSPGKPEDQALPTTSPLIPPNASPAVAPNTPNAPSAEDAASNYTHVNHMHPHQMMTTEIDAPRGRGRGRKRTREPGAESVSRGPPKKRGPKPGMKAARMANVHYCSQIAPGDNGIKLKIKKFNSVPLQKPVKMPRELTKRKKKKYKTKRKDSDSDDESFMIEAEEDRSQAWGRREGPKPSQSFNVDETTEQGEAQSDWGCKMPDVVLLRIFEMATQDEGTLPFLVRASQVCRLWRNVAITPSLWNVVDLSIPRIKAVHKNDHVLRWLCENRLSGATDLNINWWKVSNMTAMLQFVVGCCGDKLEGLGLAGWGGLKSDHLELLAQRCPKLSRIDLTSINMEVNPNSKAAVSPAALCSFTHQMGLRLTQLSLANNTMAGLTQILNSVSENCPELQVLDLSNLRTAAITSAQIPLELLQEGCSKLRVFRIANSNVSLAPSSLQEQAQSPGFPALEELSLAVDKRGGSPQVSDNSIERILKTSTQLRLLDVRGCTRISDSSLVRVPAWDLEHLYLSGCEVTRPPGSGLELLARKWSHSLIVLDLAWSTATEAVDQAVSALAEKGEESPLRSLNLLGSSVSFGPVKEVLLRCPQLSSLNLSSCRGLPRGIKRNYEGRDLDLLRQNVAAGKFDELTGDDSPNQNASSPQDEAR